MREWVEQARVGRDARYSYRAQVRRLVEAHPHAPLTELPAILRRFRLTLPARSFAVLRTATLSYLRDTLGQRADLYGDVLDVKPPRADPKPGNPFTVDEVAALDLAQPYLGMAVTLFTTGMNPKEYEGKWEVEGAAIRIHGTKRAGRERVVPLLLEPVLPAVSMRWFRPMLKRAAPDHVLYDLRRGYAHLLESAGVPPSRIKAYMGHGVRSVTDVYLRHEVLPHLREDAERVAPSLAPLRHKPLTMLAGLTA